jgi:ribonuclease P protein component
MSNTEDFRRVTRSGVRVGRPTVVVHARRPPHGTAVRVGFVVSKQVGNAVTRNRVKRRLRHLAADQLGTTPPGVDLVVRALPRAAKAPASELVGDFSSAWPRAVAKAGRP